MKRPKRHPPESPKDFVDREIALIPRFRTESDRGRIILCGTVLDEDLRFLLTSRMRQLPVDLQNELMTGFGPLASFSGKIKIAYAFQFIDEDIYHDLNIIRGLRNHFAHDYLNDTTSSKWIEGESKRLIFGTRADTESKKFYMLLSARREELTSAVVYSVAFDVMLRIITATRLISAILTKQK